MDIKDQPDPGRRGSRTWPAVLH